MIAPISCDEEELLIQNQYVAGEELLRLKSGQQTRSTLLGKEIGITDSFWYLHSLKEIFATEVYCFRSQKETPYILDCGANIGLSVIYFKRRFPRGRVVAFEPDTRIFSLLKGNLEALGYPDVVVENKAVWREKAVLEFAAAGSLGGRLCNTTSDNEPGGEIVKVPAVRLRDYLNESVDFLKMDIEGAELDVLKDCAGHLKNVERLFVEYHGGAETEQELENLLSILRAAGFRVYIKEAWNNLPFPFLREDYRPCYDLQLNVFAYRGFPARWNGKR